MNLTDEEIVSLGVYCESVLQHELWHRLVAIFEQQQFASFMATEPKATKEREALYAQFAGVQSFLGTMADMVKQAAQINQQNAPSSLHEDDVL